MDSLRTRFWALIGVGIAAIMLAGSVWVEFRALADASLLVAAICIGYAVAVRISMRRDKYDLGLLREVHERLENDDADEGGPVEKGMVFCIGCGENYDSRLPLCPRCRMPQGGYSGG